MPEASEGARVDLTARKQAGLQPVEQLNAWAVNGWEPVFTHR